MSPPRVGRRRLLTVSRLRSLLTRWRGSPDTTLAEVLAELEELLDDLEPT